MPTVNKQPFHGYLFARGLSNLMDEVWFAAVPLWLALNEFSQRDLGIIQSASTTGDLLGFVLLPFLAAKASPRKSALLGDAVAATSMLALGVHFLIGQFSIYNLAVYSLLTSFGFAIWFANSDATIAEMLGQKNSGAYHRLLQISLNFGQLAGPFVARLLIAFFSLPIVALVNSFTYFAQLVTLSVSTKTMRTPSLKGQHSHFDFKYFKNFYGPGLSRMKSSPILFPQTIVSIGFKISLLTVPFVILHIATISGQAWATFSASCVGIGMVVSAISLKKLDDIQLGANFYRYTIAMSFVSAAIPYFTFTNQSPIWLCGGLALWGFFVARYQIFFRTIRQRVEPASSFPSIVAVQGLAVRILQPFCGIVLPLVYRASDSKFVTVAFPCALALFVIWAGFVLRRNYQSFLLTEGN
jgi:hypothetical protein